MTIKDALKDCSLSEDSIGACGEIIEISGVIKWFDGSKGYGFIVPDLPNFPDILLHVTVMRRDGFQTALEGAKVICAVEKTERGLKCVQVKSIDCSSAIHPSEIPARTHVVVTPESGLERAIVKWFNRDKGFGFLSRGQGTEDIFIHMETLRRFGLAELRSGQVVLVRFGKGEKGLMTAEIYPDIGIPFATH
ncbi:cold-shock protein [Bartonella vinsonii]|uniref:Cold shock-like protein CspD n=1 Tax=Bartonella vinsonii TaxID=33047 RepID=A0A3S4ZDS1_BARVI|nr:cold-shock protein [Bartonella vinsonii]VEJ46118.1 Cold shock-like protein CspD [Bartonella vinsonii]